jgi:predicted permease
MTAEGYAAKPGQHPEPYMNAISPNYFATLGVPILAGRDFTLNDSKYQKHGDEPDNFEPTVIIINDKFAKKYFPGRNPIGLHLGFGSDPNTHADMEIVGVVKDIKYTNLRDEIPPQAFIPIAADRNPYDVVMYMRTTDDPRTLMSLVRQKLHALDPNLPVYDVRTTDEQIRRSLRNERLIASLSSLFGALATLLAIVGLYGVLAYNVSRKTREIGIRMALGAIKGNVIWLVMKEMLILVGIGIVIGLPAAIGLSKLVQNQLYGLTPNDPATLTLATVGLLIVSCMAGYIPALRASRIDPTRALRYE